MSSPPQLPGIAAMVFATGVFVVNDSFMKVAAEDLPPFEVLFLRGVAAAIACALVLTVLGQWRHVRGAWSSASLQRGTFEMIGVLCYIVALAKMPIADVVAIGQTAPLILIGLVWLVWREDVGPVKGSLVAIGFAGALLVAQPSTDGVSPYAALAFTTAALVAVRDLVGRRIGPEVPAFVATLATVLIVMAGAGIATTLTEEWVMPRPTHLAMLALAGVFVMLGQFGILLAYRLGSTAVVAPFYYSFTVWAIIAGLAVFGEAPNALALAGILMILASGLAILAVDRMRRPAAAG